MHKTRCDRNLHFRKMPKYRNSENLNFLRVKSYPLLLRAKHVDQLSDTANVLKLSNSVKRRLKKMEKSSFKRFTLTSNI